MATKKVEVGMDGASKTVEVKEPPKKTCNMKDVLPVTVIPLIAANPKNPVIRNLLLAHLKVPVPEECDTFDKIKVWIEHNIKCDKPEDPIARQYRIQQEEEERRARNSVQVAVAVEATDRGRCNYAQDQKGEGVIPLNRERLVRIASEAGNPSDFFESIETEIQDNSPGDYISMNDVEGASRYYDHEVDYDDDQDCAVSLKPEGKEALKAALREADPELYRSLFEE